MAQELGLQGLPSDRCRGRSSPTPRADPWSRARGLDSRLASSQHEGVAFGRGHLRALFAFDRQQRAVILVGGDKTNDWEGWNKRNIRVADERYDTHLRSIGKETPWLARARTGERSAGSSR